MCWMTIGSTHSWGSVQRVGSGGVASTKRDVMANPLISTKIIHKPIMQILQVVVNNGGIIC